jgi:hypothetical protein
MMLLLFQPGTRNPIAGLRVVDLEAIKVNPNSVQLQPAQDLLQRYYVSQYLNILRFEVSAVEKVKIKICWDVIQCCTVYHPIRGTFCLHLQG